MAQAQVTVTPIGTVQHSSPYPLDPEMPADVCMRLESSEGKTGPELKELESPSVGTGLETPGQQCPPNGGMRDRTNYRRGLFDRGRGFKSKGKHFFTNGTRWYASRDNCDTGKTQVQDN